jgi:hypothetical protein
MAKAIISDTTSKNIKNDLSYLVKIYSRGNKAYFEFDTELIPDLLNLIKLARQNGIEWYKLEKIDGKWERQEVSVKLPNRKDEDED